MDVLITFIFGTIGDPMSDKFKKSVETTLNYSKEMRFSTIKSK